MKASEWLRTLPPSHGPAREAAILAAVREGWHITPQWCPVTTTMHGHTATLYCSADALQIGEPGDSVRVSTNALTAQAIADMLGASLETSRIHDLAYGAADVKLEPILNPGGIKPGDPRMADTDVMVAFSTAIDAALGGRGGLVREIGKTWAIHPRMATSPTQAINYGFLTNRQPSQFGPYKTPRGLTAWQTIGGAHDVQHVDYSQICCLVLGACIVDGQDHQLVDVMRDPDLAWLVSDDGPLKVTRYHVPISAFAKTDPPPEQERNS